MSIAFCSVIQEKWFVRLSSFCVMLCMRALYEGTTWVMTGSISEKIDGFGWVTIVWFGWYSWGRVTPGLVVVAATGVQVCCWECCYSCNGQITSGVTHVRAIVELHWQLVWVGCCLPAVSSNRVVVVKQLVLVFLVVAVAVWWLLVALSCIVGVAVVMNVTSGNDGNNHDVRIGAS